MARSGWSSLNFLRCGTGVVTATACTISVWANTSVTGASQCIVGLQNSGSAANRNCFRLLVNTSNQIRAETAGASSAAGAVTTGTISASTWFHAAGRYISATSRAAHINGGTAGTDTTNLTPSGINRTSIGVGDGSAVQDVFANAGTGLIAEVAIWNVDIGTAAVAALAKGVHPFLIRPETLVAYWPLLGRYSPEINLKSNSATMAVQGTLSQAAHPRIFMPPQARGWRFATAAAGGGVFNPYYYRHLAGSGSGMNV